MNEIAFAVELAAATCTSDVRRSDLLPLPTSEHLLARPPSVLQPNYRLFVINLLPDLLVLDFKRVKPTEREAAQKLSADGQLNGVEEDKGPSKEQITAIKAAIQNAKTLEEVTKLEAQLKATGGADIDPSKAGMDLD